MSERLQVVAVVVTWNRRELLLESLDALARQTRPLDAVVVIDNAATDGTAEAVRDRFPQVELVRLSRNTGGAGGFAAGLEAAHGRGADWIWLMDDDTVPHPDALEALLDARDRHPGDPVLLASRVVWTDGRPHPMNTPRPKPFVSADERDAAERAGCVPIRSASFVSILVEAEHARRCGLPVADYFLWNDDFEWTMRLLRGAVGLLCPASVVEHKTKVFGSTDADPGERFFFEVRNKVWLLTRSRGLSAPERLLYLGATVRRWARTIRRSDDRPVLWRGLRRGLRAGLRAPQPTERVLAQAR
ncbi:glycosyltransferase family protein [Jatrophihabitans fulvus]